MADKAVYSSTLSSRAQKEIAESWEWYEERQQGLGDRFFGEVMSRIHQIEQNPKRYPNRNKTYKETIIETFPFLIIYKINKEKKQIQVLSVFHTARNPRKKYK